MTTSRPLLSVCIPAYNRALVLPELLESILTQDFENYEVVICEDNSPEREAIRCIVQQWSTRRDRIRYFENDENLGFDGNLRRTVTHAAGEYVVFMGNDDLMCPGALRAIAGAIGRYQHVGVLLRSYAGFVGTPANIVRTVRYFESERFFAAGARTMATFFRRSVVIPGLVVHRDSAAAIATDRFDGTTLYQLYLVSNILWTRNGVFLPDIVVLYREGGTPDFGNSVAERERFTPKAQTIESSLTFVRGMLDIAADVEATLCVPFYLPIVRDVANYSSPILAMHRNKGIVEFIRYAWALTALGFWRSPYFFIYFGLLLILGPRRVERLIQWTKQIVGYTPVLGRVYAGETRR
jgi:abequosyltransferase